MESLWGKESGAGPAPARAPGRGAARGLRGRGAPGGGDRVCCTGSWLDVVGDLGGDAWDDGGDARHVVLGLHAWRGLGHPGGEDHGGANVVGAVVHDLPIVARGQARGRLTLAHLLRGVVAVGWGWHGRVGVVVLGVVFLPHDGVLGALGVAAVLRPEGVVDVGVDDPDGNECDRERSKDESGALVPLRVVAVLAEVAVECDG
mmetsp:Transcript_35026/g.86119  ORF Transcript_35026/g.86119 Transcript_35026/m.86119 type:complete len:203 (-) Transcript_35026:2417-3025(-)